MARLTDSDVRDVTFKKAAIGRRGYDEEEVDAFLDEVAETLATLAAERRNGDRPSSSVDDVSRAVLTDLDQIKMRLARIEAALAAPARRPSVDPLLG